MVKKQLLKGVLSGLVVAMATSLIGCEGADVAGPETPIPLPAETDVEPGFAENALARVPDVLIGPELAINDMRQVRLQTEWMDDVLTSACNIYLNQGVPTSSYGQRREWRSLATSSPSGLAELEVLQFVGAFRTTSASDLMREVSGLLNCAEYNDRQGEHLMLGEMSRSSLPEASSVFGFCEEVRGSTSRGSADARYWCTVLLGRDDIATRIQVKSQQLELAEELSVKLAEEAARALEDAW